ncbi:group 3 secretory phospholipase A2-like [Dryobates pubescens]|uniref:group 3 secretory phospholipase A2-like n=1 Tax=Dryobates pubescens TaxID=118200 RepID=UPI0023B95D3F|nr:group 3 secretory phospholipase A2-like [Dryobates pubescens]
MWGRAVLACAALCACARAWPGGAVCARRVAGAGGARYVAFLSGGGPGAGPAALVESAWTARGRLRACWARRDPRLARAFRASCARRPPAAPGAALRRDLAALWRRRAACADPAPPAKRRRRGWTLPGTLWCGLGDSAGNSSELGLFRGPDRCCREHDLCSAQIAALQFSYGIRNYRLHTVSHCDCDARFRRCLLALNDTVSNLIGITFFNLLEVPCFVLEDSEECVQWHWWGGCARYAVVPLARMVQQSQYQPRLPAEETGGPAGQPPATGRKASRAGRKRLRQGPEQSPRLRQAQRPLTAPRLQGPRTLSPAPTGGKAEPAAAGHPAAGVGLEPSPATAVAVLEQELAGGRQVLGAAQPAPGDSAQPACTAPSRDGSLGSGLAAQRCRGTWAPAVEGSRQRGRACRCYKRLDKCEHQVAPQEVKYQLHNVGTRTFFHCNCTRRLARFLRRARDLGEAEVAVLADRIATDCFVLEPHTGCSPGEGSQHSCMAAPRAVPVPARHLQKILRHWGPLHGTSEAKHPDWKTQSSGGTLYEQCLRLALEQRPGAWQQAVPR